MEKLWNGFIEYIFLNNFRRNNFHITIHGKKIYRYFKNFRHFSNFELMSMELTKWVSN